MKNPQGDITLFLQTQAKRDIAPVVYKSITKHRKSLSTDIPPPPPSTFILHSLGLHTILKYFKKQIQL